MPKETEEKDLITTLVDYFERLSDKYGFDEDEQAEFREIIFGAENARDAAEPMYDAEAVEMVEEEGEED